MMNRLRLVSLTLLLTASFGMASAAQPGPAKQFVSVRISESEYRNTIADIFGADIAIKGQFEPGVRTDGLLAVGQHEKRFSPVSLEYYDNMARGIAAQIVKPEYRRTLFTCEPKNIERSDGRCASQIVASIGRFLFRRPLDKEELTTRVKLAGQMADKEGDFYSGISSVVAGMLIAPQFLNRVVTVEPDPAQRGGYRVDSYSRASLLSFYLWNAAPDDMLLVAAEKGELQTSEGLQRQVSRMIASPRAERGVRAFFSDMLGFDEFNLLSKDPNIFPEFTVDVLQQAQEQTLRTIVNHVVRERHDYRDLFTTPETFLTRSLAAVYGVPVLDTGDGGQPDRWVAFTYPQNDPRSGILSEISFVGLHSPAGRSSPTVRGKAFREHLLCQRVPPPPGNVDFKAVEDTTNPIRKTARERLSAHATNPVCAGCHKITDPIGLALENFSASGTYRTTEHGAKIDTSGEYKGVKFSGPVELARIIRNDPAVTSCVARRSFAYAAGRLPPDGDSGWQNIETKFKSGGYDLLALMQEIAVSPLLLAPPLTTTQALADNR
jgi:hypothetical protein